MSFHSQYDQILVDIIHYVYYTPIDSALAYHRARHALLDALGCAIESLALSSECRSFIGPVVPDTVVPNGFRLPGTSYELDPLKGAFDMGAMIRYLDHNDAYSGAEWGHPSDNLGAIIAISDFLSRSHQNGVDEKFKNAPKPTLYTLLTAQIKAYEIQGVFQNKNSFNKRGLDHTILVKVAATAVSSFLLGLSEEQALSALSHAWQDGHPLRTFRQSPNAGPRKGWAAGDACMRAVHLALMAKAGQPGAPTVLTAPKWGFYDVLFGGGEFKLVRPYGSWVMETVFFKLITAEGHAISAVEAAMQLVEQLNALGLKADEDIEKITIRTQQGGFSIINKTGTLMNYADRDHCMRYIVAVVLLKGSVIETEDYSDESPWATDPRVEKLRKAMEIVEDEQFTKDYHDLKLRSVANAIKVELRNGVDIPESHVQWPVGHIRHPDTLERAKDKFKVNMKRGGFDDEKIEMIMEMVERDDTPVHEFINLFVRES